MALQNYKIDAIKGFLNDIYYIPNYQREYSWGTEEIEDFWKDIEYTKDNTSLVHFFGQIVVHNDEERSKKYIIDGQQRTITSIIFLRALQLIYIKLSKDFDIKAATKRIASISNTFIGDYDETDKNPHLNLGDDDNDFFINNIICGEPSTKNIKKKSQDRMNKAFRLLHSYLVDKISFTADGQEKFNVVDKYFFTFIDSFKVMYIEATKLDEAFIIFETLNARGKDLETADLLKNYIFSKSTNIANTEKKWNLMIDHLDTADPTKYIRHYWNSSHSFVRDKELYHEITRKIVSARDSNELMERLEKYAQAYHDMANPEDSNYFSEQVLINSLSALNTMKARTYYPVVLAMLQAEVKFSEKDIAKVVSTVETYIFRNFTICGKVANRMDILMSDIALSIYESELNSVEDICSAIRNGYKGKEGMVSDIEFKTQFEIYKQSNKEIIRYILRKIHNYLENGKNEINVNNMEVHIEHIMPVNNNKWNVDIEFHDEYLWRLGNLALLSDKLNGSASNDSFDAKKPYYRESKIEPNKQLAKNSKWGKEEIEARQKQLAGYALEIWK